METKQERLQRLYESAYDLVKDVIGKDRVKEQARKIIGVEIDKKAKTRNGQCRYKNGNCIIGISDYMFECSDVEIMTTLIHEILHTFKDTKGHDYKWKWYAKKITDNTEYTITRCRYVVGHTTQYKYEITCENCGKIYHRHRIQYDNWYNHYYRCGKCKSSDFRIVDLEKAETIL